jgi:hypothetical protein
MATSELPLPSDMSEYESSTPPPKEVPVERKAPPTRKGVQSLQLKDVYKFALYQSFKQYIRDSKVKINRSNIKAWLNNIMTRPKNLYDTLTYYATRQIMFNKYSLKAFSRSNSDMVAKDSKYDMFLQEIHERGDVKGELDGFAGIYKPLYEAARKDFQKNQSSATSAVSGTKGSLTGNIEKGGNVPTDTSTKALEEGEATPAEKRADLGSPPTSTPGSHVRTLKYTSGESDASPTDSSPPAPPPADSAPSAPTPTEGTEVGAGDGVENVSAAVAASGDGGDGSGEPVEEEVKGEVNLQEGNGGDGDGDGGEGAAATADTATAVKSIEVQTDPPAVSKKRGRVSLSDENNRILSQIYFNPDYQGLSVEDVISLAKEADPRGNDPDDDPYTYENVARWMLTAKRSKLSSQEMSPQLNNLISKFRFPFRVIHHAAVEKFLLTVDFGSFMKFIRDHHPDLIRTSAVLSVSPAALLRHSKSLIAYWGGKIAINTLMYPSDNLKHQDLSDEYQEILMCVLGFVLSAAVTPGLSVRGGSHSYAEATSRQVADIESARKMAGSQHVTTNVGGRIGRSAPMIARSLGENDHDRAAFGENTRIVPL